MSYLDKENGPYNSTIYVTPRSHFKPIVLNNSDKNPGINDENEEIQMLFKKEDELNKTKSILNSIREERDLLRRKIKELNDEIKSLQAKNSQLHQRRFSDGIINTKFVGEHKKSFPKLAGKIKLKRTSKNCDGENKEIYGRDLMNKNISSNVAEQLISTLRESSNVQEIVNDARNAQVQPNNLQKQFEIELELSHCERDHVKSENNLLQLTVQEIKERYESIQLLFEKCEANNSAYQIALNYSEIGFSLCKILLGKLISDQQHIYNRSQHNDVSNKIFYEQLMNVVPSIINSHMSKNFDPRDTVKAVRELTNNLSWENFPSNTKSEKMLQHMLQSVLSRIQVIRDTCAPVKTSSVEKLDNSKPNSPTLKKSVSENDFENAVLLNELTAVKKEFADYKMQYCIQELKNEKHKKYGTLIQNDTPCKKLDEVKQSPTSDVESTSSSENKVMSLADLRITQLTECEMGIELSQALHREKKLENHIESLANTLERLQKNSELRHAGSQQVLEQFKQSYSTLAKNMKRLREKHNTETNQLKQNIADMTSRHNHVVIRLKEEILMLERENENKILPDNETAL